MAQKRHKPKDEIKHAAIERSAVRLFLKQGFSYTSMEMIAADARVTKQTVYSHFKSKDALFAQMIASLSKKHAPAEMLLMDEEQSIDVMLHRIGMGLINMLTSKEGLAATRLVISELHRHPRLAERYYKDATQKMVELLAQFLARQHKRKILMIENPESAAACFFSMLKGRYYVRMLLNVPPAPNMQEKENHVKETVKNFLKLYGRK